MEGCRRGKGNSRNKLSQVVTEKIQREVFCSVSSTSETLVTAESNPFRSCYWSYTCSYMYAFGAVLKRGLHLSLAETRIAPAGCREEWRLFVSPRLPHRPSIRSSLLPEVHVYAACTYRTMATLISDASNDKYH